MSKTLSLKKYIKITTRCIINLPNLLLSVLILLVIWNSWLSTSFVSQRVNKDTTYEVELRVLEPQSDYFNRLAYSVWINNQVYTAFSPRLLEVGKVYLVEAKIDYFDLDQSSEIYSLGIGVSGEVQIQELKSKNIVCDLACTFFNSIWKSKKYVRSQYFSAYCQDFKIIIDSLLPNGSCKEVSALSVGLVLGGSQDFSKSLREDFRRLGLSHLVAVSGFQVVLVASFIEFVLLKLNLGRRSRVLFAIVSVFLLVLLVGPQPSVLRSSISVIISMLVLLFLGRRVGSLRSMLYSLLIMLCFNPLYVYSISFQLSALATMGIISAPKTNQKLKLKTNNSLSINKLLNATSIAASTYLFTLPIIINLNNQTQPFSILVNLLLLPFLTFMTVLNILGLLPVVGGLFLGFNAILQSQILFFIKDASSIVPNFALSNFGILEMVIYYLVLVVTSEICRYFFISERSEINPNTL
ncbi:MAG: ComEC/Rec2 family competence protein [Patescibacteria group bacterium]